MALSFCFIGIFNPPCVDLCPCPQRLSENKIASLFFDWHGDGFGQFNLDGQGGMGYHYSRLSVYDGVYVRVQFFHFYNGSASRHNGIFHYDEQ